MSDDLHRKRISTIKKRYKIVAFNIDEELKSHIISALFESYDMIC